MKESYVEDLASQDGPDHVLATREGAAGVGLGCAQAGLLSLEMGHVWGADAVMVPGRRHRWRRMASRQGTPRVGEPGHARDLFMSRTERTRSRLW